MGLTPLARGKDGEGKKGGGGGGEEREPMQFKSEAEQEEWEEEQKVCTIIIMIAKIFVGEIFTMPPRKVCHFSLF